MPVPIESNQRAAATALRVAMKAFSSQAVALNRLISRTVKRAVPDSPRFHQDMRMALKAQAQYRATLKILLELKDERTRKKKRENRTNILLVTGILFHDQWVTLRGPA